MSELSPQAQAVLDVVVDGAHPAFAPIAAPMAAAALRAVAAIETHNPWGGRIESTGSMWMRDQILAIATELEKGNDY